MTFSEFKEMANESLIVRCRTVQERYNALTLFKAAGIEIRHKIIDRLQIDSQEDGSIYLHPGSYNGIVSCFINPYVFYVKHTIEYCEIETSSNFRGQTTEAIKSFPLISHRFLACRAHSRAQT